MSSVLQISEAVVDTVEVEVARAAERRRVNLEKKTRWPRDRTPVSLVVVLGLLTRPVFDGWTGAIDRDG
jgi:hypothetical protein